MYCIKSEGRIRTLGVNSMFSGSTADGIAVDSISRLLFYTDTGFNIIALMTLDGSEQSVVINSGLDEPRAIVLDPVDG